MMEFKHHMSRPPRSSGRNRAGNLLLSATHRRGRFAINTTLPMLVVLSALSFQAEAQTPEVPAPKKDASVKFESGAKLNGWGGKVSVESKESGKSAVNVEAESPLGTVGGGYDSDGKSNLDAKLKAGKFEMGVGCSTDGKECTESKSSYFGLKKEEVKTTYSTNQSDFTRAAQKELNYNPAEQPLQEVSRGTTYQASINVGIGAGVKYKENLAPVTTSASESSLCARSPDLPWCQAQPNAVKSDKLEGTVSASAPLSKTGALDAEVKLKMGFERTYSTNKGEYEAAYEERIQARREGRVETTSGLSKESQYSGGLEGTLKAGVGDAKVELNMGVEASSRGAVSTPERDADKTWAATQPTRDRMEMLRQQEERRKAQRDWRNCMASREASGTAADCSQYESELARLKSLDSNAPQQPTNANDSDWHNQATRAEVSNPAGTQRISSQLQQKYQSASSELETQSSQRQAIGREKMMAMQAAQRAQTEAIAAGSAVRAPSTSGIEQLLNVIAQPKPVETAPMRTPASAIPIPKNLPDVLRCKPNPC